MTMDNGEIVRSFMAAKNGFGRRYTFEVTKGGAAYE